MTYGMNQNNYKMKENELIIKFVERHKLILESE